MSYWTEKKRESKRILKEKLQNARIYLTFRYLRDFMRGLDAKPILLVIPAILSLLGAVFEGISIGLLVPMMKGMIERDYSFIREMPILGNLVNMMPEVIYERPNAYTFLLIIAVIFFASVTKNVLMYGSTVLLAYQIEKFCSNLRKLIFERYLSFGKMFFDRNNTGYLHTVLGGFTHELGYMIREAHALLSEVFLLFIYLALMLFLSWKLTIFSLIVFPILHYSLSWLVKNMRRTSSYFAQASQSLSEDIFNILSCIPLVKAYTKEEDEKKKFAKASDLIAEIQVSMTKKQFLIQPLHEIITLAALLILVGSMAFVIVKEQAAEISSLLVFFFVIRRAMGSFGVLNRMRLALARTSGPISKIMQMRDDKDKYFVIEGAVQFNGLEKEIQFKGMSFSYFKNTPILKDLSFSIEKGKMIAIVGPTGAGKTTIINLLMRFYDCPPGTILVDGADIREFTFQSLRQHISFISQDVLLFNDTLRANITYGLEGKCPEEKIYEAIAKAQLSEFVSRLPEKLDTMIGDRGVRLSGGEKQRVAIARALLKEAEILILDEATSALDSRTERLIQTAIDVAVKGRTSIVIAHRLSTVKHADKILVIENGSLAEEGMLNELIEKKGKFYQYWEEQKFF
ncbi:MAG: ABC transporter ATP-binding protein [Candidatus Omnitrophica bacterium]|nr:ABC transporter ATP-binding protein [Candidatus Omnitrophota bacterium]